MRDGLAGLPAQVDIALPGRANDPDFHLATYVMGQGADVVFCHGFPDLALGWQHQLPAVAEAGYRAIAPDLRGYGGSSCPHTVDAYTMTELTGDLVALLDAMEIEKAIFVGHDWGGWVIWAMAVLHPDRVLGIAAACTPYIPFPSVAVHTDLVDGDVERQYVSWFQEDGTAETYMDRHVRTILSQIHRTSVPLEDLYQLAYADGRLNMNPFLNVNERPLMGDPVMDEASFEHYVRAFEKTGFRGGINWYRNIDRNREDYPDVGIVPLETPCLMLTAELDPGLRPEFAADMPERCSNLEMHLVEGAAHWVQQECPERFNTHLIDWLGRHS